MFRSKELPDCLYQHKPILISPNQTTPNHSLYLSNLDDQKFLRFSIKYLYVYNKAVCIENLKSSLSKVLVEYYPFAGRLKVSEENEEKYEVDCNGEGALFVEAFMDYTVKEFLDASKWPNMSWRKLLYRVEAQSFLGVPPLVIQVTRFECGGMVLCIGINHCLCDGIGSSQFLHAWANMTAKPDVNLSISPFHTRHLLCPRTPPQVTSPHPEFTKTTQPAGGDTNLLLHLLHSQQSLTPICLTFTPSQILNLKKLCIPSLKCTSFEALASHTWRCWIKSLNPPSSLNIKLLFSANIRRKTRPELPQGYYGNGFVLACAETTVKELVNGNVYHGVKLVQEAKKSVNDEKVKSMIDLLEQEPRIKPDLSASLVISQWNHLGLEDLDFGQGKPVHMGPLVSEIYCIFLPVVGDLDAVKVMVSVPESDANKFEYYMMTELSQRPVGVVEEHCNVKKRMMI